MTTTISQKNQSKAASPRTKGEFLSVEGQMAFAERFIQARDEVENAYYAELDRLTTPRERTMQFLSALGRPMIGKPVKDVAHFYETFGRLMRLAWLSLSAGIYTDEIRALPDPAVRLHTAQVNTVDIAWQPALDSAPEDGLLVEVGTGRGNSVARLAQLRPKARIVSITISPEQAEIARKVVEKLGAADRVEIRLGDVFDPAVTQDLLGAADAVTVIEVTGHFPHEMKAKGIAILASMLKTGAPLSVLDTALVKPVGAFMERYFSSQSWYFGTPQTYLSGFQDAGMKAVGYTDYGPDILQTFTDSTTVLRRHRAQFRREFGAFMALVWPEFPKSMYLPTVRKLEYAHVTGIKS